MDDSADLDLRIESADNAYLLYTDGATIKQAERSFQRTNCGYCKDCKWWKPEDTFGKSRHECTIPEGVAKVWVAVVGPHGRQIVYTDEDYGCVQWEAKAIA